VREAPARSVPLPPDIEELTFCPDVAEAIVVAYESAARSAKGVQKIQLLALQLKSPPRSSLRSSF
jgi:hypothetical protein